MDGVWEVDLKLLSVLAIQKRENEMKVAIVKVRAGRLNVQYLSTIKEASKTYKLSNAQYEHDIDKEENFTLSETNKENYPCQIDVVTIAARRCYFFYDPRTYDIDIEY